MCDHDRISIILASLGQVSAGLAAGPMGADWWLVSSSVGDASSCDSAAGCGSMGERRGMPSGSRLPQSWVLQDFGRCRRTDSNKDHLLRKY